MQINPNEIVEKKILVLTAASKVQQVGIDCTADKEYIIPPHSFVNLTINEQVNLPADVYCEMRIRSSLARQGLFIATTVYDPGFHGTSGAIFHNSNDEPVTIPAGYRVLQAVFYKADAASLYQGKYNDGSVEAYSPLKDKE